MRLDYTFANLQKQNQKAFIAYVAAGDPSFELSLEVMHTLADIGADVIELGLQFSDPLADGIVNQMAAFHYFAPKQMHVVLQSRQRA